MGFRFHRRVRIKGGLGINLSKSGGSLSYRDRSGSVGTNGFSIRTGIPGLTFRQSWGGKNAGVAVFVLVAFAAFMALVRLLAYLIPFLWQCMVWLALTAYDFGLYLIERWRAWRNRSPSQPDA